MNTTTVRPERVRPGVAWQRVHLTHPETGEVTGLHLHHGTEAQARAAAEMQFVHETEPRWRELHDIVHGG